MARLIHRVQKVIRDFNQTWDIDLKISRIVFWNYTGAQYIRYGNGKGWIFINPYKHFQIIEEDIIHELGHAVLHQYKVKRKDMELFWKESPNYTRTKVESKEDLEIEPPYEFVSWYATVSGTEDFCETLSAWVTNNYHRNGIIYGNWKIQLRNRRKLKKKFLQVEKILQNLSER